MKHKESLQDIVNRHLNDPELGKLKRAQAESAAISEIVRKKLEEGEFSLELATMWRDCLETEARIAERKSRIDSNNVLTVYRVLEIRKAVEGMLLLADEETRLRQFEFLSNSVLGELQEPQS